MKNKTAASEFTRLDNKRKSYLDRCERYSGYTLTRVCPPINYDVNDDELNVDYQSVGAQLVNHLVNRLMLVMFAPSRPFIRLSLEAKALEELQAKTGVPKIEIEKMLAGGERRASKELDRRPARTKLFDILTNLVVVGDALTHRLPDDDLEVFDIRDYVIRRTPGGRIAQLVVRESVVWADLDDAAKDRWLETKAEPDEDKVLTMYRWVTRVDKDNLTESTWLEDVALGGKFDGAYTDADSPWGSFAWHLKRNQDYGTGHVEDYAGDFSALSSLSQAEIQGALLASEFRWLVNPAGQTKVSDLTDSENGAAIPGVDGDVVLVTNSKPNDLRVVNEVAQDYIRRLGQAFLLSSAMTRDAERVTAAEIRRDALELETGLGGVYTRLAGTLQMWIAQWLLRAADLDIKGTKLEVSIITGLDALSRNGDLDALRAALADIGQLQALGPAGNELVLNAVITTIFLGYGLDPSEYLKTPAQKQQEQEAQIQANAANAGATAQATNQAQA